MICVWSFPAKCLEGSQQGQRSILTEVEFTSIIWESTMRQALHRWYFISDNKEEFSLPFCKVLRTWVTCPQSHSWCVAKLSSPAHLTSLTSRTWRASPSVGTGTLDLRIPGHTREGANADPHCQCLNQTTLSQLLRGRLHGCQSTGKRRTHLRRGKAWFRGWNQIGFPGVTRLLWIIQWKQALCHLVITLGPRCQSLLLYPALRRKTLAPGWSRWSEAFAQWTEAAAPYVTPLPRKSSHEKLQAGRFPFS